MKPCAKNRKKIAWLAVDALDSADEQELRTHLESCPPCRAYWKEMSALTGKLSSARSPAGIETSERFHQQVVRAVRNDDRISSGRWLSHRSSLVWRVALPAIATCAVVIAVLSLTIWHSQPPLQSAAALPSRAAVQLDLEPTASHYQMVANESLDRLDALLTSQGNRNLPPAPRFTGRALIGANAWE